MSLVVGGFGRDGVSPAYLAAFSFGANVVINPDTGQVRIVCDYTVPLTRLIPDSAAFRINGQHFRSLTPNGVRLLSVGAQRFTMAGYDRLQNVGRSLSVGRQSLTGVGGRNIQINNGRIGAVHYARADPLPRHLC